MFRYRCWVLWNNFRDSMLNEIAIWCMKHCWVSTECFYQSCEQLSATEIEIFSKQMIEKKERGKNE